MTPSDVEKSPLLEERVEEVVLTPIPRRSRFPGLKVLICCAVLYGVYSLAAGPVAHHVGHAHSHHGPKGKSWAMEAFMPRRFHGRVTKEKAEQIFLYVSIQFSVS